jgi:hypothetical protein
VFAKNATLKRSDAPEWSDECLDFVNRLLQRRPEQRLGFSGGAQELKGHPWIRDLNWKKLSSRDIESPFIPLMKKADFDQDEQITIEDEEEAEVIEKNSLLLRKPEFQELFKLYYFEPTTIALQEKEKHIASKAHLQPAAKAGLLVNAKRRENNGPSHPDEFATIKNSLANLKKTNASTANSTEIANSNISGFGRALGKTP